MDMFWIESDLIDKVGTKKGYSLDNKWTYAIISEFCQKHIPISHRESATGRYDHWALDERCGAGITRANLCNHCAPRPHHLAYGVDSGGTNQGAFTMRP